MVPARKEDLISITCTSVSHFVPTTAVSVAGRSSRTNFMYVEYCERSYVTVATGVFLCVL